MARLKKSAEPAVRRLPRSTRKSNQDVIYDQKYHPMDNVQRPNSARVLKRQGKSRSLSAAIADAESDTDAGSEDSVSDFSEEEESEASQEDQASESSPSEVSFREPDPKASRHSARGAARESINYSMKHHPQDAQLPGRRGARSKKRKAQDNNEPKKKSPKTTGSSNHQGRGKASKNVESKGGKSDVDSLAESAISAPQRLLKSIAQEVIDVDDILDTLADSAVIASQSSQAPTEDYGLDPNLGGSSGSPRRPSIIGSDVLRATIDALVDPSPSDNNQVHDTPSTLWEHAANDEGYALSTTLNSEAMSQAQPEAQIDIDIGNVPTYIQNRLAQQNQPVTEGNVLKAMLQDTEPTATVSPLQLLKVVRPYLSDSASQPMKNLPSCSASDTELPATSLSPEDVDTHEADREYGITAFARQSSPSSDLPPTQVPSTASTSTFRSFFTLGSLGWNGRSQNG